MDGNYGKEVFEIMSKIHMLTHKAKPKGKVGKGEFMMLCRIELLLEEQKKKNDVAPGVCISELNKVMKASKPATSKMLKGLEEKNYIVRVIDKKDRRVTYVNITELGIQELEEAKAHFSLLVNHLFEKLGEKDATELIRIFNKMYQIISDEYAK